MVQTFVTYFLLFTLTYSFVRRLTFREGTVRLSDRLTVDEVEKFHLKFVSSSSGMIGGGEFINSSKRSALFGSRKPDCLSTIIW